jgi:hypothetical protein
MKGAVMTHCLWFPRISAAPPRLRQRLVQAAVVGATLLAGAGTPALAARDAAAGQAGIQRVFEAERAACLAGFSHQDRATCLKEAAAARNEALRGRLDNGETPAQRLANALERCRVQPAADRADCERLARGEGHNEGSVAEGAVMKQLITRSVGSPRDPAAPAVTATPAAPVSAARSAD